jgi:hypothetical protein
MSDPIALYNKALSIGLGSAVERLINLHTKVTCGLASTSEIEERKVLFLAMNSIPLDLSFSCNITEVPTTVEMFKEAASTSCCRLVPPGSKTPAAAAPAPVSASAAAKVQPIPHATPPKTGSRR